MALFGFGEIDYSKALYNISDKLRRTGNVDVEAEVWKLSDYNEELFNQLINTYVSKYGAEGTRQLDKPGYVYLMHADGFFGIFDGWLVNRIKIGFTNSVERRTRDLNGSQAPCPIRCIKYREVSNMKDTEGRLHKLFDSDRKHGEYFNVYSFDLWKVKKALDDEYYNQKTNKLAPAWTERYFGWMSPQPDPNKPKLRASRRANNFKAKPDYNTIAFVMAVAGVTTVIALTARPQHQTDRHEVKIIQSEQR